jgi:zinc/manganese transport system substrate-binding protein
VARGAESVEFEHVANVTKVMPIANVVGPLFQFGRVHLNSGAANATGQMVMVHVDVTAAIKALASIGHDDVDLTTFDELFELGVDSGERNLLALAGYKSVQFLGTDKTLYAAQDADDLSALRCISGDRHPVSVPTFQLLSRMILVNVVGMILRTRSASPLTLRFRVAHPLSRVLMKVTLSGVVALGLSACNSSSPSATGVVRAVGAENQYANVISQVGGRYVQVSAIMSDPNTDPHTFEVSTGVARSVASAQLIVQNGVGYDEFMNQLESASPNSSRDVIDVQTLVGLPLDTKNPHLWYNPRFMTDAAVKIERDLAKLDPKHASYFARRLDNFKTSIVHLDKAIATFRHKFAGTKVATTEPVADYLLSDLGLDDLTPFRFQADIMNGVDPSPEDISLQQSFFTSHRVKVFCYNAQVSSSVTTALRSLAQKSEVPVVAVYETMPTPGYDYQSWMLAEVNALTKAFVSKTSTKEL